MTDLKLFEVRLGGLVTLRVVTTTHERALRLALQHSPIKPDDAVVIMVLPSLIMDNADD